MKCVLTLGGLTVSDHEGSHFVPRGQQLPLSILPAHTLEEPPEHDGTGRRADVFILKLLISAISVRCNFVFSFFFNTLTLRPKVTHNYNTTTTSTNESIPMLILLPPWLLVRLLLLLQQICIYNTLALSTYFKKILGHTQPHCNQCNNIIFSYHIISHNVTPS